MRHHPDDIYQVRPGTSLVVIVCLLPRCYIQVLSKSEHLADVMLRIYPEIETLVTHLGSYARLVEEANGGVEFGYVVAPAKPDVMLRHDAMLEISILPVRIRLTIRLRS